MTMKELLDWLNLHRDEKIKTIYQRNNPLDVIGVKITDLRDFAKRLGVNHELAVQSYDYNVYETMMLGTMIADFHHLDLEQMKDWAQRANQTNVIDQGLVHLMLMKPTDFDAYLSWCEEENVNLRYAGYAFLSAYFRQADLEIIKINPGLHVLSIIEKTIQKEPLTIQNAMNNAVVMAGLHVPDLVNKAHQVANAIGYILPLKVKNQCNVQSASDYLVRYQDQPKYSRVARLNINQKKG